MPYLSYLYIFQNLLGFEPSTCCLLGPSEGCEFDPHPGQIVLQPGLIAKLPIFMVIGCNNPYQVDGRFDYGVYHSCATFPLFWAFQNLPFGEPGHRSPYLSHAKRALYHLS